MKPEIEDKMDSEEEPTFWGEFVKGVKESPKLYFAPLVLLFKAIRSAFRYIARQCQRTRISRGRV